MADFRNLAIGALTLAGASMIALAYPAVGKGDPESILPEGFGTPVDTPPPPPPTKPTKSQSEKPASNAGTRAPGRLDDIKLPSSDHQSAESNPAPASTGPQPSSDSAAPAPAASADFGDATLVSGDAGQDEEVTADAPAVYEIPPASLRRTDLIGRLVPGNGGMSYRAFGALNGKYLMSLMRDLDAPIASRWESILLRRALLSQVRTPSDVNPADWVAERAWLLLRMGEADAARAMVQSVDVFRYTPKLMEVAAQAALATADPAAMCPVVSPALGVSKEPIWPMARAICAGLSGEAATASSEIDRLRNKTGPGNIDLLLAEKVIGAGSNGRRSVKIEWEGVDQLTSWRFGMASAVGVAVPEPLYQTVGLNVRAWQARAPLLSFEQKLLPARIAAILGVVSSQELIDTYAASALAMDPVKVPGSDAGLLRAAYLGRLADRVTSLRKLWAVKGTEDPYGDLILTSRACAYLPAHPAFADDANNIVAAIFSGGLDTEAARWVRPVTEMDNAKTDLAWAALALGIPADAPTARISRVKDFIGRDSSTNGKRSHMLVAGLIGLGRLTGSDATDAAEQTGLNVAPRTAWEQHIHAAAARNEPGTVALLAAIGMQTTRWQQVPAEHLYHIVAALRQVGLEAEARMIAVEAITRT